ncbi:TPA: hypothetical protein ACIYO5_005428, partial [Escherichia coli]
FSETQKELIVAMCRAPQHHPFRHRRIVIRAVTPDTMPVRLFNNRVLRQRPEAGLRRKQNATL